MSTSGKNLQELITEHLNKCKEYVDSEIYFKALSAVKKAKSVDARNIYLIALEKQVKLLSDLSKQHPLDTFHINKVKSSIPEIISRAIDDAVLRDKQEEIEVTEKQSPSDEDDPYTRERELAFKKLKDQYFTFAEKFFNEGDFRRALEEIRRIYIIDPGNTTAKDYEEKILRVGKTQKRKSIPRRVLPYLILLLVIANAFIFFLTYTLSEGESNDIGLSDASSDVNEPESLPPELQLNQWGQFSILHELSNPDNELLAERDVDGRDLDQPGRTEPSETNEQLIITDQSGNNEIVVEYANTTVRISKPYPLLKFEPPVYPAEAIEEGIEGIVIVRVLREPSGIIDISFVERSDHSLLSDSALRSIQLSQFYLLETEGIDNSRWVSVEYEYRIHQ